MHITYLSLENWAPIPIHIYTVILYVRITSLNYVPSTKDSHEFKAFEFFFGSLFLWLFPITCVECALVHLW